MKRASLLALVLVIACGGGSKNTTPVAPLPDDKPAVTAQPTPPPTEEPATPKPLDPIEITVPATTVAVKLVNGGKGKKAPLRYAAKPGAKQTVELAIDFSSKQTLGTESREDVVPTVVLTGEAETKAVDPTGKAEFTFAVTSADAREATGAQIPLDKFKLALASLSGMVMSGSVDAQGNTGDMKMRIEKPDELTTGALDLVKITMPTWPVLPKEPVGAGAKWQATTTSKLAGKFDVTYVTDYQLVKAQGATWTIKGTTKVTGTDQQVGDQTKVTKIAGTGTTEASLTDGALYPTAKSNVETGFTVSEGDVSMTLSMKVGGAITAK